MILTHEKVLNLLQTQASAVLRSFDEPWVVMLTVVWKPELGELPHGAIVIRNEDKPTPDMFAACMKQASKLVATLSQGITEQMKLIEKQQEHIRDLEKQVRPVEGQTSIKKEAPRSADYRFPDTTPE